MTLRDVTVVLGGNVVLDGCDATFASGRVHAVVGPSGSGKTTLLGVVGGLQRPDVGSVSLTHGNGTTSPISSDDVVWVPQGVNVLVGRSVLDNVMIGPLSGGASNEMARDSARAALRQVGLENRGQSIARELSGGELQRVALARAVAAGRPIVLVDEPTSSLDARNAAEVARILGDLATDSVVIVATHDEVVREAAHTVLHLRGT
ncbi:ATP-binding cassette domain-containing protein [Sanguibacter sp. A247]|uniref:ATP-binding cassette domain-containing protein n=1 Tax=unclassified Sanguibacter TaxID=2645534 RepID=UPI003FD6EEFC